MGITLEEGGHLKMSLKVQIPYRGNIPIIHKRGPIACIELEL